MTSIEENINNFDYIEESDDGYNEYFANPDTNYYNGDYYHDDVKIPVYALSAACKPKPIQLSFDNKEERQLNALKQKVEEAVASKIEMEKEFKEKIQEMEELESQIKSLEETISKQRSQISIMKNDYATMNDETIDERDIRTQKEIDALKIAKQKYQEIKDEIDSLVIPVEKPKRNFESLGGGKGKKGFKSENDLSSLQNDNIEKIKARKQQLSNLIRNREIDIDVAKQNLLDAQKRPSRKQQLNIDIKNLANKIDENQSSLGKLRHRYLDFQVLQAKINFKNEEIKKAISAKHAFQMRGCSLITKNGIINYDNNGNIIKEIPGMKELKRELDELNENPPMKEVKGRNIRVSTEYDYLVGYYTRRMEFIKDYQTKHRTDPDVYDWYQREKKELKDVAKQIKELEKTLYDGTVWLEEDHVEIASRKQLLYEKYGITEEQVNQYKSPFHKNVVDYKPKKYTMDDFIKSLRR
jgi:chromosome segregation ATPase